MQFNMAWTMIWAMAFAQATAQVVTVTIWQTQSLCSATPSSSTSSSARTGSNASRLGSNTAIAGSALSNEDLATALATQSPASATLATDGVSTPLTALSSINTSSAINLVSPIVGSGSVAVTVVAIDPSSTISQPTTTVSAAVPLPTTSDEPRCGTVFLDSDQQLSRIYCNATFDGQTLPVADDRVIFAYCITACEQNDACVAAVFDNSTNTIPSDDGSCSLRSSSGATSRKRQDVPTLTWKESSYVAYRIVDVNAPLPADTLNPLSEPATESSTSTFQLIPSIQPPLDLSTTIPPTGGSILPTDVPLGVSVIVITSSSVPNLSGSAQQSRVAGGAATTEGTINRVTRVARVSSSSTTAEAVAAGRVTRATRVSVATTTTLSTVRSSSSSSSSRTTPRPSTSSNESRISTVSTTAVVGPVRVTRGGATTKSSTTSSSSLRFTTITTTSSSSRLSTTTSSSRSTTSSRTTSSSSRLSTTTSSRPSSTSLAPRLAKPTLLGTGVDETQYGIALPFTMSLYTESSRNLTVTTNGIVSLGDQNLVYEAYTDNSGFPEALPSQELLPGTALVWWQYLESLSGAPLGVYYSITDSRLLFIEWLLHDNDGLLTNVIMTYDSANAGGLTYYYFSAGDTGRNSVVGVQGLDTNNNWTAVTYEAGEAGTISAGLMLAFTTDPGRTSAGSYAASRFSVGCFPQGSFPAGTCGTAAT